MDMETVPVSYAALMQRLNRFLATRGERLCRPRAQARCVLGDHYLLSLTTHEVVGRCLDLEEIARRYGALRPYEVIAST